MENTTHNLYAESLSAKVNRLEQTIEEIKALYSYKVEEINKLNKEIEVYKQNETKNKIEMRSLKELNSSLLKGQEIDKKAYKQATSIRDKRIDKQDKTIVSLVDQVDHWKELYLYSINKSVNK